MPLAADHLLTLTAAARRIVPHAFESAPRGATLVSVVAARIDALPPHKRKDFELALDLLGSRWATLASGTHPVPFAMLGPEQQDRLLNQWAASRIGALKTVVQAIRRLVLLVEYSTPDAHREIGYLGAFHTRRPVVPWEGALDGPARDNEPVARGEGHTTAHPNPWRPTVPDDGALLKTEIVVIGSGAGGAMAAATLAEAGHDVLILEEGSALDGQDFTEQERDLLPRLYAEQGLRATEDLSVSLVQGATLGGGTAVNWMIMLRTPEWVLDEWQRRHGTEGLSPGDLAPIFDRIEADTHTTVVPDDAHSPNNRILLDGARALGWRVESARINARDCIRTGFCGTGCRTGAKQSALQVYLPRALDAGARLVTDARADRIEMVERGGAFPLKRVSVTVRTANSPRRITVEAPVVVIAAGAVGTPVLLQRSGMGGGGVGRFLRLHPTTVVTGRYDHEIYGAAGIPLSAMSDEHLRLDANGYGFWTECPPIHPALTAPAVPGFGPAHREQMLRFRSMGSLISLVRDGADLDQSNGDVRIGSGDRIRIRYKLGKRDAKHVIEGMVASARIHLAAGATEVCTVHSRPVTVRSERDLDAIRRASVAPNDIALFSAHVNGTARMGTDREHSGTDPHGERHGASGVFVADGSLLPTALGVNPQETIMALARVVASRISSRRRPG